MKDYFKFYKLMLFTVLVSGISFDAFAGCLRGGIVTFGANCPRVTSTPPQKIVYIGDATPILKSLSQEYNYIRPLVIDAINDCSKLPLEEVRSCILDETNEYIWQLQKVEREANITKFLSPDMTEFEKRSLKKLTFLVKDIIDGQNTILGRIRIRLRNPQTPILSCGNVLEKWMSSNISNKNVLIDNFCSEFTGNPSYLKSCLDGAWSWINDEVVDKDQRYNITFSTCKSVQTFFPKYGVHYCLNQGWNESDHIPGRDERRKNAALLCAQHI